MIGIIGAMEQEVSQVVAAMTNVSVSEMYVSCQAWLNLPEVVLT